MVKLSLADSKRCVESSKIVEVSKEGKMMPYNSNKSVEKAPNRSKYFDMSSNSSSNYNSSGDNR